MIQLIGLIVGPYVITRMIELIARAESHRAVKISAILTLVVAGLCTLGLLTVGIDPSVSDGPY